MAKTTWILLADGGGARLFQVRNGSGFELLLAVPHPQGRMDNREIDTDRDGRTFQSTGGSTHVKAREQDPKTHAAEVFAHHLADLLRDGRVRERFDALVLVAEPAFLGRLRAVLDKATHERVTAEVGKDLMGVDERDLPRFLRDVVPLADSRPPRAQR